MKDILIFDRDRKKESKESSSTSNSNQIISLKDKVKNKIMKIDPDTIHSKYVNKDNKKDYVLDIRKVLSNIPLLNIEFYVLNKNLLDLDLKKNDSFFVALIKDDYNKVNFYIDKEDLSNSRETNFKFAFAFAFFILNEIENKKDTIILSSDIVNKKNRNVFNYANELMIDLNDYPTIVDHMQSNLEETNVYTISKYYDVSVFCMYERLKNAGLLLDEEEDDENY